MRYVVLLSALIISTPCYAFDTERLNGLLSDIHKAEYDLELLIDSMSIQEYRQYSFQLEFALGDLKAAERLLKELKNDGK